MSDTPVPIQEFVPAVGIIVSCSRFAWCKRAKDTITQYGNKTFPVWECVSTCVINSAQADLQSDCT